VQSTWRHNVAGIVPNTLDTELLPPTTGGAHVGLPLLATGFWSVLFGLYAYFLPFVLLAAWTALGPVGPRAARCGEASASEPAAFRGGSGSTRTDAGRRSHGSGHA